MDILDNEASEDEAIRKEKQIDRPSSHEANDELVKKAQQYRQLLEGAAETDELVRNKWDEWEANIIELTWDEVCPTRIRRRVPYVISLQAKLNASVPSSTGSLSGRMTSEGQETRLHAQELRQRLESLDNLMRLRQTLVERAARLAEADDVRPRVTTLASGLERWAEVEPVMFEDIFDEELAKYDKYTRLLQESKQKQDKIVTSLKVCIILQFHLRLDVETNCPSRATSCLFNLAGTTR